MPILLPLVYLVSQPIVLNVHGTDIIRVIDNRAIRSLSRIVLTRINLLIVPTVYFKDLVLEHFPEMKPEIIYVSPSGGINRQLFKRTSLSQKVSSVLVLGFVSRFIEEKGWRIFLDALKRLANDNLSFKGVMVGKGPDENDMKEYIKALKLNEHIDLIGFVPQDELPNIYNDLDIYIFPTYREAESLGLTGLEAMSCGVPVIGSMIAGPATYIRDGYNGFTFPPKNSEALSNKIKAYAELSREERESFSTRAEQTAKNYDQQYVAKNLLERLKESLTNSLK